MFESLIQFLNDHKDFFYTFFRKFVDYTPIKDSAIQLDEELKNQTKEILQQKGYLLKVNQYCLIIRKQNNINLLILNKKNKLYKQIDISIKDFDCYDALNEHNTYSVVG